MFKIKYLRNILFISFLIAIILPLYNIFFVYPSFIRLLTESIEDEAVRVGNHLSSTIVTSDESPLSKDSVNADLIIMAEELLKDFRLMKLKIFSDSGEILYSTDPGEIGTINKKKYFHEEVSKGKIYTIVVQKGDASLEGQEVTVDVVETYVPIMNGERFRGAFEIYYDITNSKASLDKQLLQSSVIQLFVAGGFFITVIFVLLKAKRTINERERAEKQIENYKNRLQILISRLAIIEDQERKRISEELHDNIGQYLALSKIKLSKLRESHPAIKHDLYEIRKYIEQTIAFTRSLTFELSSPILYQLGLEQALEWLAEQIESKHNIAVDFTSDGKLKDFKGEISVQLYKTVHELFINIVKHSRARKAAVNIGVEGGNIKITVEDDGKGFDFAEVESDSLEGKHFGLFNIRERISFFKGTVDIASKIGRGTMVTVVVPMQQEEGKE